MSAPACLAQYAARPNRKASVRSNRICFTLANPTEEECLELETRLKTLFEDSKLSFAIVGQEIADSGLEHLQGFIHCPLSFIKAKHGIVSWWKLTIPSLARAHLESARGSDLDSENYCTKDGFPLLRLGTPAQNLNNWEMMLRVTTWAEAENISAELCIRHRFQIADIIRHNSAPPPPFGDQLPAKLRSWQVEALARLQRQDDRTILFVVDLDGGKGKSVLTKWIAHHNGAFFCTGGKAADIALMRKEHHPCDTTYNVFDMARNKSLEQMPWDSMECLKNGYITSSKYMSARVILPKGQKVIVFMNQQPDLMKLSEDRFEIMNLDEHSC